MVGSLQYVKFFRRPNEAKLYVNMGIPDGSVNWLKYSGGHKGLFLFSLARLLFFCNIKKIFFINIMFP